jgi:hypothetical protein
MTLKPQPQRIMAPEIAKTVRQALMGVVMEGTATRLRGAYLASNGTPLPVGGKTGIGDNRLDRFGRGGRLISQRVVDRTATFVFFSAIASSARYRLCPRCDRHHLPFHQRSRRAVAQSPRTTPRGIDGQSCAHAYQRSTARCYRAEEEQRRQRRLTAETPTTR